MKINENDTKMMKRMMATEMLLKEAMVGTEGAESNSIPEQVTLYSLIHEMSGLLRDSTVIMKEIGDLVKKYEDNDWEDAGDEDVGCDSSKDLTPVPGTEDVYYTFSSQSKRSANGKTYVSSPVMIMKIDEDAGEFISPDAMDLYKAAEYFSERSGEIRMSDGRVVPAFCLN